MWDLNREREKEKGNIFVVVLALCLKFVRNANETSSRVLKFMRLLYESNIQLEITKDNAHPYSTSR